MATDTAPSSTAFASSSSSPNNGNDCCNNTSDARFTCNICFDAVTEPVVTQCGHLYCWPCLFRWLAPGMKPQERVSLGMQPIYVPLDESKRVCPVCKSQCSVPTVVPIYVKTDNEEGPEAASASAAARHNDNNLRGEGEEEEEKKEESSEEEERNQNIRRDEGGHSHQQHEEEEQQQMGLDIDGDLDDHHPEPPVPEVSIPASIDSSTSAGLRQRRRPVTEEAAPVVAPRRPTPSTTTAPAATNETSTSLVQRAHSPSRNSHPPPHRASLSYGLVLAMHQTLLNATRDQRQNNSNNNHNTRDNNNGPSQEEAIPSLHYPERRNPLSSNGTTNHASNEAMMMDTDPAATLFLSRLLLGLSIFVLFCLLVF